MCKNWAGGHADATGQGWSSTKTSHKESCLNIWVARLPSGNKLYEGSFCQKEEQLGGNWNHQKSTLNQTQDDPPGDLHQKLFTPKKIS